jgi:hypothetical protein
MTLWLSHETCNYIRIYINVVADSVTFYLHDFYNIILKTKYKLYIASGSVPPVQRKIMGANPLLHTKQNNNKKKKNSDFCVL